MTGERTPAYSSCKVELVLNLSLGETPECISDGSGRNGSFVPALPQGGMFLMIDISKTGMDGEAFAWRLLEEQGVAVMPGASFGESATSLIRLALTVPDEVLMQAVDRLAALCRSLEGHHLEA